MSNNLSAIAIATTALARHINRIVLDRTEEKMVGIYTGRVIATVKDKQPLWNWPVMNLPRNTINNAALTVVPNRPIALVNLSPKPNPTGPKFRANNWPAPINSRPKSLFEGRLISRVRARAGASRVAVSVGRIAHSPCTADNHRSAKSTYGFDERCREHGVHCTT